MPAARSMAWPLPDTRSSGSVSALTTRAPRAAAPACASAIVSAWGRPPTWVQPRPMIWPSFTRTQPTAGLGQVRPSPRAARRRAWAIWSAPLTQTALFVGQGAGAQFRHKAVEVICRLEVLVNAGKADIGNGIDPGQRLHHDLADHFGRDVGIAQGFQPPHDAGNHLVDAVGINRAFLHRNADRAFQFGAVEILALAGGFHHDQIAQLHTFIGGESPATGRTKPPPPDRDVIFGRTRVLHLGIDIPAEWAAHGPLLACFLMTASTPGIDPGLSTDPSPVV